MTLTGPFRSFFWWVRASGGHETVCTKYMLGEGLLFPNFLLTFCDVDMVGNK